MTLNFHQKAMLIGGVTLGLIVGVFLWIVVIDEGTLSVTADPPYEISVEGSRLKVRETQLCTSDPCELGLPTGEFTLTVSKSGYFEETALITISRGELTTIAFKLDYIPIVGEIHPPENDALLLALAEPPTSSGDFIFVDDPTYKKQRLDTIDPETQTITTWAYFDRALVDPLVFPNTDVTQALVVDQAKAMDQLYLIDAVTFSRAAAGGIEEVVAAEWSPKGDAIFIEAKGSTTLFHLNLETLEIESWPLVSSLDKVTLDDGGHWLFATLYDLDKDSEESVTSLQMIQLILEGVPSPEEARMFSIGEYDPATRTYRLLYEVPASLEVDYDSVQMVYEPTSNRLYFIAAERFFEVVRGE